MTFPRIYFSFLFSLCITFGCTGPSAKQGDSVVTLPVAVLVSVEPYRYFVERVGGDRVVVSTLVPPGAEPETYAPTPRQMVNLAQCRVYFATIFPIETALRPKIAAIAPQLQIVAGHDISVSNGLGHNHSHADENPPHLNTSCSHGDMPDPHVWMSPSVMMKFTETVVSTLSQLDPQGSVEYHQNGQSLLEELRELRQEITKKTVPLRGKAIFVFHPAYGYYCDEFGLVQKSLQVEGRDPTPHEFADWIKTTATATTTTAEDRKIIFIQPEFHSEPAKRLAQTNGCELRTHSPLQRNYFDNLRTFTAMLRP